MRNIFTLLFSIACFSHTMASLSIIVKPLSGQECITALSNIGKIAYSGDSIYVYDATKEQVFGDLLVNVRQVRFSNESPSIPTNIENTQDSSKPHILVFPNPTQDIVHIKHADANTIRIYTTSGQFLQTTIIHDGEAQINISSYPSGSYLLLCGNNAFQIIKQ